MGQVDEALGTYGEALKERPRFPQAREYLGEAYLQAALREMEILRSYGPLGAKELRDLEKAFLEAASQIPAP